MITLAKIRQLIVVIVFIVILNECLASPATQPRTKKLTRITLSKEEIAIIHRERIQTFLNWVFFLIVGVFFIASIVFKISERRGKKKKETLLKNLRKAYGDKKNFEGLPSKILVKATRQYKRERSLIETIQGLKKEEFSPFFSNLENEDVELLRGIGKENLIAFAKELDKPQLLRLLGILHHYS